MLFDSTVRKELARSFAATLMVILTIVMTNFMIRTLGLAANGSVSPQDVFLVFTYFALGNLPTVLALSLFVGVVVSLGRMYRESEMAIWFSSGIGLTRFLRPVLGTSWPVLLVVFGLMTVVVPWTNRQANELRQRFEQRSDVSRATPGQFQTSADGRRVIFVEKAGDAKSGGAARNVFVVSDQGPRETVAVAQSGRLQNEPDGRMLVLAAGHMQQIDKAAGEYTHIEFERYRLRTGDAPPASGGTPSPRVLDTTELLRAGGGPNLGEFVFRIGLGLGATNLLLIGVGLAAANPRRASNWGLLFALLAFVIYYNLLNLSQAWVASGRLNPLVALVGLHGGAFVVAMALIWWRDHANAVHPLRALGLRRAA